MEIHLFKRVEKLIRSLADEVVYIARESIQTRGQFNIALSGGSSPEALYKVLASTGYREQVDWKQTNFFFGDERYVPAKDPQNNAHMARRILLDVLNIPEAQIFAVDTSLSPDDAAISYQQTINEHFKGEEVQFDLVLLGLGDNAHTASLFPFTSVLNDQSVAVKPVFLKQENVYRITMTAPMINKARHILFLVYGSKKAEAVHHVLEGEFEPEKYPAQLIKPENGTLQWYLDEAAASGLISS